MPNFTYVRRLFVTDELMYVYRLYPDNCTCYELNCNLRFECFALLCLKELWPTDHKPSNPNGPNFYIVPMCHACCNMIEASKRGAYSQKSFSVGGSSTIVNINDSADEYHEGRIEIG